MLRRAVAAGGNRSWQRRGIHRALSLVFHYRRDGGADLGVGQIFARKNGLRLRAQGNGGRHSAILTLLITTALVIGFAGLNISRYVFGSLPPAAENQLPNGLSRTVISVDG